VGIGFVIFYPISACAYVKVFISVVFDKEIHQESTVLQAGWVLLKGSMEINADELPFFSFLASRLSICDEKQFVFGSDYICYYG
jgi:hypothetical protein